MRNETFFFFNYKLLFLIGTLFPVLERTAEMAADTFTIVDKSTTPFPFGDIITTNVTLNVTGELDREKSFVYTCALRCISVSLSLSFADNFYFVSHYFQKLLTHQLILGML